MTKPVVLIAEELSPATVDALGPDFEIRQCNGADRDELLPAIADVDAILVRSATKVDAEALAAAKQLQVVARAGVGLDNVDVKAATQAGVMVVNAPTSNITSAAELAVALDARRGPQHQPRARGAARRRVEAVEVQRHRALREDRRHRRPRPHRRARRAAALGLRHERDRLRPLRAGRPRRADGCAPGRPGHAARRVGLHVRAPAEDAGDPRPDRRRRAAQGQARAGARQRRPRRHRRRDRALRRPQGGARRRRRHRRVRRRSPAPTAPSSSSTRSSPPRTSAPPRRRRRRRPASPSRSRCAWPSRASSCRTPSTSRAG